MANKHFICGPSSLKRRELCPGSARMERDLPEKASEAADIGTKQHAAAADLLLGKVPDFRGLTDEQRLAVEWCVEYVKGLQWPGSRLLIETKLDLAWMHPEIGGGTADVILLEDYARAIVIDFKFGRTPVDSPGCNLQLACYAAGVAKEYDVRDVKVCILNPELNVHGVEDLAAGIACRCVDIAARAMHPDAPCIPSEDACRYCKASGQCSAQLTEADTHIAQVSRAADVALLPMEQIAQMVAAWEDSGVEAYIGAAKARLHEAYIVGYRHDLWRMAKGRASRVWAEGAADALKELAGEKAGELYTTELKSPAQVEKLLGKSKAVKEAMAGLVVTIEGKPKLERSE